MINHVTASQQVRTGMFKNKFRFPRRHAQTHELRHAYLVAGFFSGPFFPACYIIIVVVIVVIIITEYFFFIIIIIIISISISIGILGIFSIFSIFVFK